jgi:feruloyl esterase
MKYLSHAIALACAVMLVGMKVEPVQAATSCESLVSTSVEGGAVTGASLVAAGAFSPAPAGEGAPGDAQLYQKLPPFCRIEATLKPSSDSDIRIEVWLPASGWNGKLIESGNGAFSPVLSYSVMAQALLGGYAATSSNTGHVENSAAFAVGHPEKIIDFGYRAVHVDAVAAKATAQAFYGKAAAKSYFEGCSTGGRQAYGAAQHFPGDFDGIVAGAPGINFTHQTAAELVIVQQVHKDPSLLISRDKLRLLHAAVLEACDAQDGVKDGVIENPLHCKFDPVALQCKSNDIQACLTIGQVKLARQIYDGVRDSKGNLVFAGLPRGTEQTWGNTLIRTDPMEYGVDAYRDVVLQNPSWDYLTLNVDTDISAADAKVGAIVNNYDPDLRTYFARGGKILGYQGWSDGMNSPLNHIGYYEKVAGVMGGKNTMSNSYRLFLVPGMEHCGGGDGTSTFDLLATLDTWVTTNKAPDSIAASRVRDGKVDRTRPLCPYPKQAVYKGSGSTDEAASFTCAVK